VSDFRTASKEHYNDQSERRFPLSFYLDEGATKEFGDKLEKLNLTPTCRILTGYNPNKHLELLGYTDKDFIDNSLSTNLSFENVVTILVPEKSLILISVIVETENAEKFKSELHRCNDILKAVYAATQKSVSNQVVTIVGTMVLSKISRNELNASNFPFLNMTQQAQTSNTHCLYLTKEQFESKEYLEDWWDKFCHHLFSVQSTQKSSNDDQIIKIIAGEMITSMCIIYSYLPKGW